MDVYSFLADLVVFVHLLYMAYVLFGQLAILIGWPLGWQWIRNPWFRGSHLLMALIVAFEAVINFTCPLTTLEDYLRGNTEEISFTGRLLRSIQFAGDNWPEYVNPSFYVTAAIIVATLFLVPPRFRRRTAPPPSTPGIAEPPPDAEVRRGLFAGLWESVIVRPLREVDDECRAYQATDAARGVDWQTIMVMVTTAVVLTVQAYVTGADAVEWLADSLASVGLRDWANSLRTAMHDPEDGQLYRLLAWAGIRGVEWLLLPMLIVRLVFGERLTDYGVKLRGFSDGWWLYLLMLGVVLPLVILVSERPSFLATYPYYRLGPDEPLWPHLWCWEAAYFVQFFFLEFFFRGFMIHGTKHRFGAYSILVMMVPYCMIHFGKPMPETLGSIVAGLVLGFMSLKTRSIWMGTALHINIALVMDLLALTHAGRL